MSGTRIGAGRGTGRGISRCCIALAPAGAAQTPEAATTPFADPSRLAGARLMKSGVASQFDSLGNAPIGHVGDSVTSYIFTYNDALSRVVHSRIVSRQRFQPPVSWRAACDEVAHPGWFYHLAPTSSAMFAVVVPGIFARPTVRPPERDVAQRRVAVLSRHRRFGVAVATWPIASRRQSTPATTCARTSGDRTTTVATRRSASSA